MNNSNLVSPIYKFVLLLMKLAGLVCIKWPVGGPIILYKRISVFLNEIDPTPHGAVEKPGSTVGKYSPDIHGFAGSKSPGNV